MEIKEAIKKVKAMSKEKFDASVEVHINLLPDPKNQDQSVRFSVTLPHGTGKTKKVAVLANKKVPDADLELKESDIENIEKGQIKPKVDFDILVAEPAFMTKLARVAKILGPAGVMPNPKTGTVTDAPEKAVVEIKKGRLDVKTEKDLPLIHTIIGKRSFTEEQLTENFIELINSLKQNKPAKAPVDWIKSVYIKTTMGQVVQIDPSSL
ncbi:MAG: 50S ribosomal protein L1 [Patescibacteria group bacterium]|nr:MAG: 50S ribosomal protein L1 [Patescibacteria group bacterium]